MNVLLKQVSEYLELIASQPTQTGKTASTCQDPSHKGIVPDNGQCYAQCLLLAVPLGCAPLIINLVWQAQPQFAAGTRHQASKI